jgi:hypothetical protein
MLQCFLCDGNRLFKYSLIYYGFSPRYRPVLVILVSPSTETSQKLLPGSCFLSLSLSLSISLSLSLSRIIHFSACVSFSQNTKHRNPFVNTNLHSAVLHRLCNDPAQSNKYEYLPKWCTNFKTCRHTNVTA